MAQRYPASWDNCATCAYWLGKRDVDSFAQWVTVESSTADGKCMCKRSGWMRREKPASQSCASYEKWPVLKQ